MSDADDILDCGGDEPDEPARRARRQRQRQPDPLGRNMKKDGRKRTRAASPTVAKRNMAPASLANLAPPAQPGQVRNPYGRPKGSRNKLSEAFLADIYADWEQHGVAVIETVRAESPVDYLKITASLLPKQVSIENKSDLTDDELNARILELAGSIDLGVVAAKSGDESGVVGAFAGATPTGRPH